MNQNETNKNLFTEMFLNKYLELGFGAMPKKEMDIFIFYLLNDYLKIFNGLSNYEVSNILKINERKLKNLILESSLKYPKKEKDDPIIQLANKIFKDSSIPFEYNNHEIIVQIEDPVLKREIENIIKKSGFISDYSFNNELLRIKSYAFFTIFVNNKLEIYDKIIKILNNNLNVDKKISKLDFQKKSLYEKIKYILLNNKDNISFLTNLLINFL